jgi:asparagine synthase (glutamine-hydrolysing)
MLAARTAAREGLTRPIPVTMRFDDAQAAEESEWQELVIGHLGIDDWERLDAPDLDFVGAVASTAMRRHGLLWPPNSHAHAPLFERAAGGSLLSGVEGDGVFGSWRFARIGDLISGRAKPQPRDALRLAYAALPQRTRSFITRRRRDPYPPPAFLRPRYARQWKQAMVGSTPLRFGDHLLAVEQARTSAILHASLQALASEAEVMLVNPFLGGAFIDSLRARGGSWGFGDRSSMMAALFGELLPPTSLSRPRKALFNEVFWRDASREFASQWDGRDVDEEIVDPEQLRAAWLAGDSRSATLLQAVWLADQQAVAAR